MNFILVSQIFLKLHMNLYKVIKKMKKKIKIWNGRDNEAKGTLYIGAYSRADACKMLVELYPHTTISHWNREITNYFSPDCWGNSMNNVVPERGVWHSEEKWKDTPKRIYPIVNYITIQIKMKKCENCGKKKKDVSDRIDPFPLAMDGSYVYVVMCDDCSYERALEI